MNSLQSLARAGQSVWLDYISKKLIESGQLWNLIEAGEVRGVTSNPAIFENAIAKGNDYAELIAALAPSCANSKELYEQLAIRDIQAAADLLGPLHQQTQHRDGYVSLEVSPELAHSENGTLDEARRLWRQVNRPNLMIKVPATPAGIRAFEQLTSEGININVTLLFHPAIYQEVAHAYLRGAARLAAQGGTSANWPVWLVSLSAG